VLKSDADAVPILFLNIKSSRRDLLQLTDIATNVFKERLQTIPGVSEVQIWGEKRYAMRLWMDPARLAAYRLSPLDVRNAVLRENVELPSGRIEGSRTELTVRTMSRLTTPEEFNNLIIRESEGRIIRFRDIGTAELGPENYRHILRRDGEPMVGVYSSARGTINQSTDAMTHRQTYSEDICLVSHLTIEYIRQAVSEVAETVLLAFVLASLSSMYFSGISGQRSFPCSPCRFR